MSENHELGRLIERVEGLVDSVRMLRDVVSAMREELARTVGRVEDEVTVRLNTHGDRIRSLEIAQARLEGIGVGLRWLMVLWGALVSGVSVAANWWFR